MAIQLNTQTAQQQKAPFSAFDTTSSYRSGLTAVSQGLDKVAQAASNIQTGRNQQKEKAQDLLAYKADQEYSADLKIRSDEYTAAITKGDPDGIAEARENFNQLKGRTLDSYSPGLSPGNESAQRYAARNQAVYKAASASFGTQENSRVIFGETTSYLEEQRTAATKAVVDNPYGLDEISLHETLTRFTGQDEGYQVRYDALSTPEQQEGFKKDLASNTTVVSLQNIKTATTLDQLERRKEILDEFVTQGVETLGLPTSSVEKIENAYRAAKKSLSDPTYKLAVGKEAYSKLNASIASFFDVTKASDMGGMVDSSATAIVKFTDNHPEWAAENKEDLDGLMATLALFSPARDEKTGEVTGESFVDDMAIRFLRYGVKNTGNLEDFFTSIDVNEEAVEGETEEQKLAREARVDLKTQHENLPGNIQTRMKAYMDKRTKLVIDGVNNGDLTSLGNLYPRLERFIEANKWDDVREFYKDVVLPQLTGRGISTGLRPTGITGRGTLNGQLRLPTEWAVLSDKEVDLKANPEQAAQDVMATVVANQDNPGAVIVAVSQLNDKSETRLLESMAARVAASGGNSNQVIDEMTTRLQLAAVNQDNKEIDQIIEDREDAMPKDLASDAATYQVKTRAGRLTFLSRIKNLERTRDDAEGKLLRQLLRGHIAQSLNDGKTPQQAFDLAEDYHDTDITPMFGVAAKSTQGHNVRLAPSTAQKFLDVDESRSKLGPLSLLYYSFKNASEGKINERDLAESTKASVIALAMRQNSDLYVDLTYGDRAYALGTNLQTPGYSRVGGQFPGAGEGKPPQAPENLDDVTDEQQRALFEGLNNNEFYEAGVGFFGPKGDGIPIVNIPETTFRTEKLPDGTVVEREYYYIQFANSSGKYEEGAGTYVAVNDVNRLLDEVVRRSTDMIPFNQPLGDILSSATGNQNSVWNLSAGLYLD